MVLIDSIINIDSLKLPLIICVTLEKSVHNVFSMHYYFQILGVHRV